MTQDTHSADSVKSAGFDLDQLTGNAPDILHTVAVILDAEGNDKSGFHIVGKNSPEYQEASRQIRIDGLKRAAKRKGPLDTSTDEGATIVAKMIESNEITLAASVVKGWFGFETKGVAAEFNKALVPTMLAKMPTWREKITSALESEANFMKS